MHHVDGELIDQPADHGYHRDLSFDLRDPESDGSQLSGQAPAPSWQPPEPGEAGREHDATQLACWPQPGQFGAGAVVGDQPRFDGSRT